MIKVIFLEGDGTTEHVCEGKEGQSLLDVAHKYDINLEGACEGSMACSTCHLYIEKSFFDKLPELSEEEEDMLDLTYGLKATSRLGCQIILNEDLDGIRVHLPFETRNMLL
jgi:2Fe-2S ferredoxin